MDYLIKYFSLVLCYFFLFSKITISTNPFLKAFICIHPSKRNYFFDLTRVTFAHKNNHGQ